MSNIWLKGYNTTEPEMSKTFYVNIKVKVNDDADIGYVVQEMDYSLTHKDIIDTEVMGVEDE